MNETDWSKIEDSENEAPYAPARKPYRPTPNANDMLMGGVPAAPDPDEKGPWFVAAYDGMCPCGVSFYEGDRIRADGDGDWEAQACCG